MKRSLDVLVAFCLLVLTLPVFLLCAIAIRLESRGPIFFRQTRIGRNFHPFSILKFRTMRHRCAGSPVTLGQDARITRSGRWMRRYKLDELPQLWNVLRGEMSIVGPRPVIPAITQEFSSEYERLLVVRPGLTDPATLKYCDECDLLAAAPDPLRYFMDVVTPDKLRLSTAYLECATVWSDLGVVAQTAIVVIAHSRRRAGPAELPAGFPSRGVTMLSLSASTAQDTAILR